MFDKFPFTNVHELNLDWILRILNKLKGGTKDQVLTRLSNKPLDFGWKTMSGGGGGGGTTDYNELGNKPSINGVTLEGNKTSAQLNIPVGPELANTMPLMDGTPQIGNSPRAAKADHVHPSDSNKTSLVDVRAEIIRAFNQYDPAEADYAPPYAVGTLGYAIENAAIAPEDIQDAVDAYLDAHPALTGMFTNAAKNALIALLEKVAYIDGNGQQYLNELITNLAATVTSISAVFTQGANIIYSTDSLDELKQYLVVTADYSDGASSVVSNYELSGTLDSATSTIIVSYGGQTDSFTVSVSVVTLFTEKYVQNTSMYYANSNTNLVYYKDSSTTNRLSYLLNGTGSHAIPRANTSQTSQTIYPIPIPASATSLISQLPKNELGTMFFIVKWNGSNWVKTITGDNVVRYGKGVLDISDDNDGSLYVAIVIRNSANDSQVNSEDRTDWKFGWV